MESHDVVARAFASRRWWFLAGVSNTVGDKELEAIDALHASITNDVLAAPRSPVQTSIDSMEDSVDGEDRGGGVVVNEFRDASGNAFQVRSKTHTNVFSPIARFQHLIASPVN